MSKSVLKSPFHKLPEALVEDMLNQCEGITRKLSSSFEKLLNIKKEARKKLKDKNLLRKDSEITTSPYHPTTCGVDGAFAVEKLLSTDILAIAGVAVEGLAPPTEVRYWPKPRHQSHILTLPHNDTTRLLSRAIMMSMELTLAAKAPHSVIFIDGSLITHFIRIYQALNPNISPDKTLRDLLSDLLDDTLESYEKILLSKKTDQIFAGVPKYTTLNHVAKDILNLNGFEDRGLLSFILKPGEFIGPLKIDQPKYERSFGYLPNDQRESFERIVNAINEINMVYYRPSEFLPVLRIEISPSIATNNYRLAMLFESIRLQSGIPGIMEPYPLYLADRMVKHLRKALPAIRRTTTQEMILNWQGSPGNIFFALHGYRTDWGK
ncbi:MAG: DNA double-strand break repair nuclease NurA [Promethearchaeota archaeon]|nr:MAG: DNA double-strand break repair nuclease NurA [Candidatus Lokiarchaeota archaeon]